MVLLSKVDKDKGILVVYLLVVLLRAYGSGAPGPSMSTLVGCGPAMSV